MSVAAESLTAYDHVLFLERDAAFWAGALPEYAAKVQVRADHYALWAAIVSAITGLGIWGAIATSTDPRVQVIPSFFALAATVLALVPKQLGYATGGAEAMKVAAAYGAVEGDLEAAREKLAANASDPGALKAAEDARQQLAAARAQKLNLKPYPSELDAERKKSIPDPFLSLSNIPALVTPIGASLV